MTNKSISKSLTVDDPGSELCRLSLETSSCEKTQGDENRLNGVTITVY